MHLLPPHGTMPTGEARPEGPHAMHGSIRRHGSLLLVPVALAVLAGSVAAWTPGTHPGPADPGARVVRPPVATVRAARAAGARDVSRAVVRHGLDVSHWQGRVEWRAVARSGVSFTWLKATEGTGLVDRTWERNRRAARRAGVLVGAYHFASPSRHRNDARREADHFLRTTRLRPGELVPALDLEIDGGLSRAALTRWTRTWLTRVEARLGVRPVLYTSPGFVASELTGGKRIARDLAPHLWVAHWRTDAPALPAGDWAGRGWSFWQWTDRGTVPGIEGPVDRNVYSGAPLRRLTVGAQRARDAERTERDARDRDDRDRGGRGSRDEDGRGGRERRP